MSLAHSVSLLQLEFAAAAWPSSIIDWLAVLAMQVAAVVVNRIQV